MKKYIVVFALLTGLAFSACARQKKTIRKKDKGVSSITMIRGACFGRCPMYTLKIDNSGQAEYEGRHFVDFLGTYRKKYRPEEVAAIFERANEYRIDTCKGNYYVSIADLPGLDYIITANGKRKDLRHAGFGPRFLSNLGNKIDGIVVVDSSWTKIKDLPSAP